MRSLVFLISVISAASTSSSLQKRKFDEISTSEVEDKNSRFVALPQDYQRTILGRLEPSTDLSTLNREITMFYNDTCRREVISLIPEFDGQPFLDGIKACPFRKSFFTSFEKSASTREIIQNTPDRSVTNLLRHLISNFGRYLSYENMEVRKRAIDTALYLELPHEILKPLMIHHSDRSGKALFDFAVNLGDLPIIQLFLELELQNINAKSATGETILHKAARLPNGVQVAFFALENGADINATEHRYGNTPLHTAVEAGNLDLLSLLCSYGSDPDLHNDERETALQMAFTAESTDAESMVQELLATRQNV